MSSNDLQNQWDSAWLDGGSMAYVDSLYEDYLKNPTAVPSEWQAVFQALPTVNGTGKEVSHRAIQDYFVQTADQKHRSFSQDSEKISEDVKQYHVADLAFQYRSFGHLAANLDPLGLMESLSVPGLEPANHQLETADMDRQFFPGRYMNGPELPLREIINILRETWCGSIGMEYMHIANTEETDWLEQIMESSLGRPQYDAQKKCAILKDLIAADGLERYLGTRYVGQKRFSLEGGDSLIPMMQELVKLGGQAPVKEMIIGMAHRGRLNVLVNVLGKEPDQLFREFEGKVNDGRSGDVKYHMGFSSDIDAGGEYPLHLALAFNPSHLEIISPVVEGSVRARLVRLDDLKKKDSVIPIVIHGDAAFSGQGVVMETFNFSQARGYSTGGTIHIVINNQIGFTTSNPEDARSTHYCTDIAKMVQAPIIHVNGDDPEAVVFATNIAFEYRMRFKRDVVLDLVCYRRHGHNEADEPAVTQPVMYQKIKTMRPLREIYAEQLIQQGVVSQDTVNQWVDGYRDTLDQGKPLVKTMQAICDGKVITNWTPYLKAKWTDVVDTTITKDTLQQLSKKLTDLPKDFALHPVVKRMLEEREKMSLGELPMNWGYAETMAYASLLQEGYGIRLSGQDCGRGTFAHRHAVLHDTKKGGAFIPLETIATDSTKSFQVIDSVLSEEAVLAFEYGYAASEPRTLVLWEAQFGDFANGAQVVIDQFISSGEQKWGRLCGLVMLLPHGYEGQGPEHSSARLERYMQLCAQQNMQVCTPTTPAQIFHLLRRQMIRDFRKPLIIMTPKSLLRNKLAVSPLDDLFHGKFHNIIPEIDTLASDKITRIILCCGKVYYDLLQKRREENLQQVSIIRVEQLYPFPKQDLVNEMKKYPNAKTVIWCQEEPQNQGVWFSSQHNMVECLQSDQRLYYAGREFAAAPSAGSLKLHMEQQQALVDAALLGTFE